MSSSAKPIQEYPVQGLMPKQDTQATTFLKKYPEYDGRNTVIAILDTGVDPGAAGMQVTTDGKPKMLDLVDCTGGGDVTTTTKVKPTVEGDNKVIQGLSGRKLILDRSWNCPSDEYRIGIKRAYELFPKELVSRLKLERREVFEQKHSKLLSEAQARVAEFAKNNPSITDEALLAQKADLEARVDSLKGLLKSYEDPGIILDCVLFFDGKDWRAVIDVDESGDLRGKPCLTDYRKEFQYYTFGEADLLNFSVNIYQNGDLLRTLNLCGSIVTLSGSHGTHVAGITAANFPDEPELNGVAPGAQIVSLRIGDARLGSMETGPGLTRAAAHLAMHQVDLANMSYGESSGLPTDGHFINLLAKEAIGKSGCIFVTSAGNDGPCFSSIGAPAGMDSSFITVGAYVKHAQMQAEYALLESVAESPYTWSSRGPCTDGYRGVDIYAPGSAITSVPVYGLNKLDLKNGTSMSSPNACGCVALLVSALKAKKIDYTPYRLKAAVVQTSKSVNDPLNVGFIQVDKAWEYLETYKDRKDLDVLFEVNVTKRGKQRGVYLREQDETSQIQYLSVKIQPTFMGEKDPANPLYNRAKFDYEARVAIVTTESWISAPDYLYLHSGGNAFQVKVDPTALTESEFHYGEVLGYDTASPEQGPLFRVPVSVVKPIVSSNGSLAFRDVEYGPGAIFRRFLHVPEGATYAELTLRSRAPVETGPGRFMLHLLQLIPKKSQKNKQTYTFMLGSGSYGNPDSNEEVITKRFAVKGGLTLEVCLAQFWSALGKHVIDVFVEFHGVQLSGNLANGSGAVHLEPQITRLEVAAPIRREDKVEIGVSFNKLRKYLRPTESTITPMHPDRDTLPNGRLLYALVLSYSLKVDAATTVTPSFPTVMNRLYEHFLAGVFGIVYDANRKAIGYLDVFSHKIKLENKGEYTIMLQLTTEEENVLEKLKNTVCEADLEIKSVNFSTYSDVADVYREKAVYNKGSFERRDQKVIYVAAAEQQQLPKEAKAGDGLVGSLSFTKANVDGGQYGVLYTIPPSPAEATKDNGSDKKPDDEKLQLKLNEGIRDLQISYLRKAKQDSALYQNLLAELERTQENDIVFLEYKIDAIWTSVGGSIDYIIDNSKLTAEKGKEVVNLAEKILGQIDQRQLLEFFGRQQPDKESDEAKENRKANDAKKKQVLRALKNKALVTSGEEFEAAYKSLQQWTTEEATDLEWLLIKVKRDRLASRYGNALKSVQKYLDEVSLAADTIKNVQKVWTIRAQLYRDLEWDAWSQYDAKWSLIRLPPGGYAPF
ncbi:tripeptidyl-peptidase II Tpp2 [Apophysomyces ossiformis]|uniref:tripeptidyl-peptidase II n=1 Tax=Apophysomyces ossiformis TaxID=679940 RepID=A0A8H7BX90_9FUNG|nr:tripeptidyl-peptidase II Tpp2 [Apophysomyces ossiformis]